MIAILGIGNPDKEYAKTRHNVGKFFIDFCFQKLNLSPKIEKKLEVSYAKTMINGNPVILGKTLSYMNLSGKVASKFLNFFKIKPKNLFIVHDDLDIPLGKFRIDFARGPKLHNGIISIAQTLNTKNFWRIRIGVDNRQKTGWKNGETYVLEKFLPEEEKILVEIFEQIFRELELRIKNLTKNRKALEKF